MDTDTKGSVSILDTEALRLDVYPLPRLVHTTTEGKNRSSLDYPVLAAILIDLTSHADAAFIEQQWSRPATNKEGETVQGIASTFTFGQTYGDCRTAVAAGFLANFREWSPELVKSKIVPVPALVWKHALRLDSNKKKAVTLANKLFPRCARAWELVKHTSAAEASLIAFYGAATLGVRMIPGSIIRPSELPYTKHGRSLLHG